MNKFFLIVVPILLIILFFNTSNNSREQKRQEQIELDDAKSHPTKYKVVDTLKPSKYLTEIKVILDDKKLRDINSYDGLGEFICNKHAKGVLQCNVSFTNEEGSKNFVIPEILTDHTDYYNNIAAVYNGNSKETRFSCYYVKGITASKCIDMGSDLLIAAGELKPFNFEFINISSRANLLDYSYTGNINLLRHDALKDKMTDTIKVPEMYSMTIGTTLSSIKAVCLAGNPPIIKFSKALSDKYEIPQQLLYRVDDKDAVVLKQSIDSYLITKDGIEDNEIILSPKETSEFINEIKGGNKLTIGRELQREIDLKDLTRLWEKLESYCT